MKLLHYLLLLTVVLLFASTLNAQKSDSIYKAVKEANGVWRIVENNTVNIYLVEGKDSALVIDAGYGKGDLKAFIRTLTGLPLILVNTHGHGDHIGADLQFEKVYLHSNDYYMINGRIDSKLLSPIKEGYIFDLGGREIEVMEVPGHTPGSICLFDKANKILFAGDHINAIVWLFLKDCLPLEVYLESLEKVKENISDFRIIMPGHNEPLEGSFINEKITCVKNILDGTCTSEPYNYSEMTKGSMLCTYKNSKVAYDPNKLFEKQ